MHGEGQEPAVPDSHLRTELTAFRARLARGEAESMLDFLARHDWLHGLLDRGDVQRELVDTLLQRVTAAPLAPAAEQFGRFQLLALLGRGGMGTVHLAYDTELGRQIALKRIRPEMLAIEEARQRFRNEALALSRLDHQTLCRVHDVGEHDGVPFIVMQLVRGTTLKEVIESGRPFGSGPRGSTSGTTNSRDEIAAITALIEQVARGLQHAHDHGLVHRDVKPGNIMLNQAGEPVILDFGLVRDVTGPALTASGAVMGTQAYMSPEQVQAIGHDIDHRTDIYSLGVVLYECLTRVRPFATEGLAELARRIVHGQVTPCHRVDRRIPADLSAVVHKAMAPDRRDRYASAAELADELRRVRTFEPVRARSAGPLLRTYRWSQRNPRVATLLVLLSVTLVVVAGLWQQSRERLHRLDLLGAGVLLDRVRATEPLIAPAWPSNLDRVQSWHDNVVQLETAVHAARHALAELAPDYLPYGDAERALDRATHPQADRLHKLQRQRERRRAEIAGLGDDAAPYVGQAREALTEQIAWLDGEIGRLEREVDERRTFALADPSAQVLDDTLRHLVGTLEQGELQRRAADTLRWARTVDEQSIAGHAERWQRAIDAIRGDPRYGGLELAPQTGLVPLGADPTSGLQEFWHMRSGAEPMRDAATGRLVIARDTGLVFVLVPGGSYWMGFQCWDPTAPNYENDPGCATGGMNPAEIPPRRMQVRPFFLGKYEASQHQWASLSPDPDPVTPDGDLPYPVSGLDWYAADRVLRRHGLRLPAETEWEYACRAGTATRWWSGDDPAQLADVANLADRAARNAGYTWSEIDPGRNDGYAWFAPIDALRPNPFGLHQVHGNVLEWVEDMAEENLQDVRVIRGGCLNQGYHISRSASVQFVTPNTREYQFGVRAARSIQ